MTDKPKSKNINLDLQNRLVQACLERSAIKVKNLLQQGADPNEANERESLRVIKLLIQSGADTQLKCKKGKTVFDYARENEQMKVAESLIRRYRNTLKDLTK